MVQEHNIKLVHLTNNLAEVASSVVRQQLNYSTKLFDEALNCKLFSKSNTFYLDPKTARLIEF